MTSKRVFAALVIYSTLLSGRLLPAQQTRPGLATPLAAGADSSVPALVPFTGSITDASQRLTTGQATATFLIYKTEEGGEPLFAETQAFAVDATGHYKVQLGATLAHGLPLELFATGDARWLEVQFPGESAQPRLLLASVPYALKAADAATLGGLPASAFARASPARTALPLSPTTAAAADATGAVTTPGGVAGFVPVFTSPSTIGDSILFQGAAGLGINTMTPNAALDLYGRAIVRGSLYLARTGDASPARGFNSSPLAFYVQAYNTAHGGPVGPSFQWQAEVTGNNTPNPGATLNLLYGNGLAASPAETGLYINPNGTLHFAPAQTFPGTGGGTITGVTAGAGLTGGGTSGTVTLNLDTSKVPLLSANNRFTGNQLMIGSLGVSGALSGATVNAAASFSLDGSAIAFGTYASRSIYLGFSGSKPRPGNYDNTAVGWHALSASDGGLGNVAIGSQAMQSEYAGTANVAIGSRAMLFDYAGVANTAAGSEALFQNTTGSYNTGVGFYALGKNTEGNYNIGIGYSALLNTSTGMNNTASGVFALGSISAESGNTAEGFSAMSLVEGDENTGLGDHAGQSRAIGVYAYGNGNTALGADTRFGLDKITNSTAIGWNAEVAQNDSLVLGCVFGVNACTHSVSVGIGTTTPDALLSVNGTADKPGGGSWGTYSDGRLKTLNGSYDSGLRQVMRLRPIRYRYKPGNALGIRDAEEHIGVVAQEVQRVIPEAVTENSKGYLLVNNDPVLWSMVNAIQEQQKEIAEQRRLIQQQSRALKDMASEVRAARVTLRQVNARLAGQGAATLIATR